VIGKGVVIAPDDVPVLLGAFAHGAEAGAFGGIGGSGHRLLLPPRSLRIRRLCATVRLALECRHGRAAVSTDAVLRQQEPRLLAPAIPWLGRRHVLRAMSIIANAQPWSNLVILLIVTITGFSISLILSVIYRALINRRPIITWGVTAVVLAIAVGIYAFIDRGC
jgi:hypothetical protein